MPTSSEVGDSIAATQPSLADRHMALSFSPATDADKETLKSYIPDNYRDRGGVSLVSRGLMDMFLVAETWILVFDIVAVVAVLCLIAQFWFRRSV